MDKEWVGSAILSVCPNDNHMAGIFQIGSDIYSLTPNDYNKSHTKTKLWQTRRIRSLQTHSIQRIPIITENKGFCGNSFFPQVNPIDRIVVEDDPNVNFGNATISVAISVDEKLFKDRFQSDMKLTTEFVVIHMAYLQKQLLHSNLKKHILIRLVITRLTIAPFYDTHLWDNYIYLDKFCAWSYQFSKKNNEESLVHLLFSGSNLWYNDKNEISTNILGLTYTRRLCQRRSCVTVESVYGYTSLHTLVHEFGHNLGAHHDGEETYGTTKCSPHRFIMSWSISMGKSSWSECSLKQFRKYFLSLDRSEDNTLKCLQINATPVSPDLEISKERAINPGRYYTPDQQCRLIFGSNYKSYSVNDNICLGLKCKNPFFVFSTAGAFEGTECGPNKRCDRDICRRPALLQGFPLM